MDDRHNKFEKVGDGVYSSRVSKLNESLTKADVEVLRHADVVYYRISMDTYLVLKSRYGQEAEVIGTKKLNQQINVCELIRKKSNKMAKSVKILTLAQWASAALFGLGLALVHGTESAVAFGLITIASLAGISVAKVELQETIK